MHGSEHAGDKLVDAVALLHKRYQGRNTALIVADVSEMGEDQFLKLFNLVLQDHEIGDGLVAFIRIVDCFQAEVLFVFKRAVEFRMLLVK